MEALLPKSAPLRNRNSTCWIESYLDYTAVTGAPEIWRRWAALTFVASALGRNCYVQLQLRKIFPNLYVMLLGASGSGKSRSMVYGLQDLIPRELINVAPNTVTWEMLVKRLGCGKSDENTPGFMDIRIIEGQPYVTSTVLVAVDEISNFIQEGNPLMLDVLTALYDCPDTWDKQTKSAGSDHIEGVCINILGGVTPEKLLRILPDGSFKFGFTSRLIVVYSDEVNRQTLFPKGAAKQESLGKALRADLEKITQLWGEFQFTPEVQTLFDEWWLAGMQPVPNHPRLKAYNTRRQAHVAKLMLILAAARGDDKWIDKSHCAEAIKILMDTEVKMIDGFQQLAGEGGGIHADALHFMKTTSEKRNGAGIPEPELRAFLVDRIPAYRVRAEVEELLLSGMVSSAGGMVGTRVLRLTEAGKRILTT